MKSTLILTGLIALVVAQKSGTPKSSSGSKGSSSGGIFAGIQNTISCATKCGEGLGINVSSGSMPTNLPCMDKLPSLASLTGGSTPDLVPALSCLCKEPKLDTATKCIAACGSILSSITTQKNNICSDPKGFVDKASSQISGLVAKFGGAAGGAGAPAKAPGGKGAARRLAI